MSDLSEPSRLQVLFDAALRDYEEQTGIALAEHPLAEQLQNCDSVESVTAVLREHTQAFGEFWGQGKVMTRFKNVVSALYNISAVADFVHDIGLHFPPVTAIHTGLAILLSSVKGVIGSYDALADLLESTEHFLNRLDIYTKIPPTVAMTEMVVKILVELLSSLALATKQIKQGKSKKLVKKLFGEKDVEVVLQRLDRLTKDEARIAAAQTLKVVYGLIQNVRVVMDDGKASVNHVKDALEIMQELASGLNKSKRDSVQQDIIRWLSPPDPWKNHHNACESRHCGSAAWFIQGDTFLEWKGSEAKRSVLWVHGKPGAGKSVLCSAIIEEVDFMRKAGLASLAFFYFDFREDQKKDLRGLLSSLLVQLCHQSDSYCEMLFELYSEHAKGLRRPSDDVLVECLKGLLKLPGLAPVYLIVDALDECPNISAVRSPRAKVLNLVQELIKSHFPNLRICVTSRLVTDIKDVLGPLILRQVSLHDEKGQKDDIEDYINSVIRMHPMNRRWKAEHKQLVISVLTKKADGMFRWVDCQVVYICGCIPACIQHALADLPETLDETYQRTLREINKAEWKFAHRLFQFVAVASRPLRVEELAELLAFEFKAGPVPRFHEGWRPEDPVHAVLSTCSSLLAVVDGGHPFGKVIQFAHFSVKEFLTSTRLAKTSDVIPRRYHISMTPAHTLAARACLGILLHLGEGATSNSLENLPLAGYAAEHWADHARFGDVSRKVEEGMKQMFDPNKPHLAVCVWIHDPDVLLWERYQRAERPLPLLSTSLHYAALWGLHIIVEFLVIKHSQDVHSRSSTDNATPLHLASKRGHVKAACMLIKHGADVTARSKDGETPLHLASKHGHVKATRMLIEHGADVTAQNKDEETPLHLASREDQVGVARLLIERGGEVAAQNKDGETPLHLASFRGQVEVARMLIERSADVTTQNKDGKTPLHLASFRGQVEVARMLIVHGADVTAQNKNVETPLHLASFRGQVEVARMLIDRGADVTTQNKDRETPLHLASREGQFEVARMLIERGADVTTQNKDGETQLHLALNQKQVEVAHILIERGADVTAQNKNVETPLHLASSLGQAEIARLLIKRGADVTAKNKDGETPLHLASQEGQVEVARMLIVHGADVMAQNQGGETPLHLASREGQVEVAHMLFERGADVTAQNKDGETPLHLASRERQMGVAHMLIERGADVTAKNKDRETPLHLASQRRQVGIARMLLELGADVTAQNKNGETPLHLASKRGQVKAARILIEHSADVTVQNKDGETPLHLASREDQVGVARLLIEHGADVTAQNKDRETPLHLASFRGKVEVVRLLTEHGADVSAQNKDGEIPLHLASTPSYWTKKSPQNYAEVARILLKHGTDVSSQNKSGSTPFCLASQGGLAEVTHVLLHHGVDPGAYNDMDSGEQELGNCICT